jgi:hypothetical protein
MKIMNFMHEQLARAAPIFLIDARGSSSTHLGWEHGQEHRPRDQGHDRAGLCLRSRGQRAPLRKALVFRLPADTSYERVPGFPG